jgi:hypothetical protein
MVSDDEDPALDSLDFSAIPLNEFEDVSEESGDDEDLESAIRNNAEKSFFGSGNLASINTKKSTRRMSTLNK